MSGTLTEKDFSIRKRIRRKTDITEYTARTARSATTSVKEEIEAKELCQMIAEEAPPPEEVPKPNKWVWKLTDKPTCDEIPDTHLAKKDCWASGGLKHIEPNRKPTLREEDEESKIEKEFPHSEPNVVQTLHELMANAEHAGNTPRKRLLEHRLGQILQRMKLVDRNKRNSTLHQQDVASGKPFPAPAEASDPNSISANSDQDQILVATFDRTGPDASLNTIAPFRTLGLERRRKLHATLSNDSMDSTKAQPDEELPVRRFS